MVVTGVARCDGPPLRAPLTGTECIAYQYRMYRKLRTDAEQGTRTEPIWWGMACRPFVVDAGRRAVRVAAIQPLTPTEGTRDPCGVRTWLVTLEMGVARCAPVGDINAGPTCAQLTEVAEQVQMDASAMVEAACCLRPQVDSGRLGMGTWVPFGPEGQCTGGIMPVQVEIDACGCTS